MTDLRLRLDDTDFERLVELGRSVIPAVAPRWTDHNVHDPGMMLVDLVAWIAEAQIYGLSRLRTDERRAYARLLGIEARGPRPARGLVWPILDEAGGGPWPAGTILPSATAVRSDQPDAPAFFTTHAVALTRALLVGLQTVYADGTIDDLDVANVQEGATFLPFGAAPAAGDRFVLHLSGELIPADAQQGIVSLGVEVAPRDDDAASASRGAASARPACHAPLRVSVEDSVGSRAMRVVADTTAGLSQSGVILLRVGVDSRPAGGVFTITLESATGEFLRPPRLRRIGLDVLPIEQREVVAPVYDAFGTGRPDQTFEFGDAVPIHPIDGGSIHVDIFEDTLWQEWDLVRDLQEASPDRRAYVLDLAGGRVVFGNGINGRVPPEGALLRVRHSRTAGPAGNLPAGLHWTVEGILGPFGLNSEPTWGGVAAEGLGELRALARRRIREERPIVTTGDLASAARALDDLGVSRAVERVPGQGCPRVRGTRILVALRADRPEPGSPRIAETQGWLDEIKRRLAPRLPLGQRLEVVAPRLVAVRVRARLVAVPNVDPETVLAEARTLLRKRLRIVAPPGDETVWPFGRDLTDVAIKGWLRNVPGVGSVAQLALLADGREVRRIALGATGLPDLDPREGDVVVERAPVGAPR
jgi:hypothetical protein